MFVKKADGSLRLVTDYRGLNKITKKNRYPLLLIHKTLQQAGKAKWYIKLDIQQAFHKVKIADGNK